MESDSKILTDALAAADLSEDAKSRVTSLLSSADLESWFAKVDESSYSLDDWIRAIADFDQWLEEKSIDARPVDSMIGYLECCTLSVTGDLSLPDFPDLARENLDRYGFDATRPASTEPDEGDDDA